MFNTTYEARVLELCEDLGTVRSLTVALLLKHGEHRQLAELSFSPLSYVETDLHRFRDDYLITEYLSKYKGLRTGINTKEVALATFAGIEEQCRLTNERLKNFDGTGWRRWGHVILRAQTKIKDLIGDRPRFSRMLDSFKWGKGATFSVKGKSVRLDKKLCEKRISVTPQASKYLRAAMATDYAWLRARGIVADGPVSVCQRTEFSIVRGNRGLTVDKNAKTDRFIAAEPSGNIFLQLGVGKIFRQSLQRVGIDLNDQSVNQGLAKLALDLGLATVDLKGASDSVSRELVWQLFPLDWAIFLDEIRSHQMLLDNKWIVLEKFSSMGNGFTFELESMIFWALTKSLVEISGLSNTVSVYGDDIICPAEVVPDLIALFSFVGFTTNEKKTHYTGLFRESCGKHYFRGKDVTPIYQKDIPDETKMVTVVRCHNRLLYHAVFRGHDNGNTTILADRKFRRIVGSLRGDITPLRPPTIPLLGAQVFADMMPKSDSFDYLLHDVVHPGIDGGLVIPAIDNTRRRIPPSQNWKGHGYVFPSYAFVPRQFSVDGRVLLAYLLRCAPSEPFDGFITARGAGDIRIKKRVYPEQRDLRWI